MKPRFALRLALVAILGAACARPPLRFPERSGWGTSIPAAANESYPARYPRLDAKKLDETKASVERELPGWRVAISSTGFFGSADRHYEEDVYSQKLTSAEIELAQRFIDGHLPLFGLDRATPLRRWHDGLYFISSVDDPRFGIALSHDGPGPHLAGHLWPGLTMHSSARKDLAALVGPWLGRRLRHPPREQHECDPRDGHPNDCAPSADEPDTTITLENVSYAIYASEEGSEVVVREVVVLPVGGSLIQLEPERGWIPPSVDARTGEVLEFAPSEASMCEEGGPCFDWGWYQDERYLRFNMRFQPFRVRPPWTD
ncbi:MAG TPA: hypothetical protein VF316_15690 [Polyangiaceae bacterium]